MKIGLIILAFAAVVVARAERRIEVTVVWLNHEEKGCRGCSTQIVTQTPGNWIVVSEQCAEGTMNLKISSLWQGDKIEVSLCRQKKGKGDSFVDDGPSSITVLGNDDVRKVELHGFQFAISARPAPEKPSQSSQPTPGS